jgi:Flp pilus assembly protein TadB
MNFLDTPFIVPVAGCLMILGLGASGIYSDMRGKELRSQERIAMLNRGVPLAEIERMSATANEEEKKVRDPLRSLGNTRRSATVLLSCGVGLILFGLLLYAILGVRPVLIVAAAGVINLAIGVGFLIDYNMQQRELARFGMEVDTESMIGRGPGQ